MKTFSFIIALALIVLSACQHNIIDNSTIVEVEGVSFAEDVLPIFLSTCGGVGCHIDEAVNGVELTNYETTITSVAESYNIPLIIPLDAASSPLVEKLFADPEFGLRMPDGAPPLTGEQIGIISSWVDGGALNN